MVTAAPANQDRGWSPCGINEPRRCIFILGNVLTVDVGTGNVTSLAQRGWSVPPNPVGGTTLRGHTNE